MGDMDDDDACWVVRWIVGGINWGMGLCYLGILGKDDMYGKGRGLNRRGGVCWW